MKLEAESVKADSIFAVLDNEKRGERSPPPDGHWSEYSTVAERDFRFAVAAKLVITKSGYFLVGMVPSKDGAYLVVGQLEIQAVVLTSCSPTRRMTEVRWRGRLAR